MIDELKQNIETEIEILREISNNMRRLDYANSSERKLLIASIESLKNSMMLINSSTPKLLNDIGIVQKLPRKEQNTSLEKIEFRSADTLFQATVLAKDRERLLKELSISDSLVKKIRKRTLIPEEKYGELKSARGYLKFSNMLFLDYAQTLIRKGSFKPLALQIKKANLDLLLATYIAMILLTTIISFIISLFVLVFFVFFSLQLTPWFITFYTGDFLTRLLEVIWIPLVVPVITFFVLYYYPYTEKNSLSNKINNELPFAVIQMSAISGSGIEPSEIFKIIAVTKEYPYLRKEVRKVLNQINIYGYDLITALSNVSKSTSSTKLAELFSGLATTITSGSDLQTFFEKRAEGLLTTYRLEREKYTTLAETFMDIYISVVIAAPMILMILLVMIAVLKIDTGFSIGGLTAIMLSAIAFVNIIFIGIIHMKQPKY